MDQDVEMDAPEISTLREESTPPPSKASSNPGFRLKLVVKDKTKTIASSSAGRQYGDEDDGDEEDEDQEDQLIDDEDAPIPSTALGANPATEPDEDPGADGQVHINIEEPNPPSSVSSTGSGKYKAAANKAPATKLAIGWSFKIKTAASHVTTRRFRHTNVRLSAIGMTGTAASSPAGLQIDESYSPEA
ncbi:hypothetical protein MPER_06976, partial [Moniliophthora perniciosa FA553]